MMSPIRLTEDQKAMLAGQMGQTKMMAMRLLLDLAAASGATELIPIQSAHLSGVSPLTGGYGLRRFLSRLVEDPQAQVSVPTTLNAAGCDALQFEAMRIVVPEFLEHSQEIVDHYTQLGVRPTQSCIPYEWEGVVVDGLGAWSESNAICFANSYSGLRTNRESGLSALASALTGYTPKYGLLEEEGRLPNLEVVVTGVLSDPTDFSILGDWIGKQRKASWRMPFGPIPLIRGLPEDLSHEQRKALSAAAANYGIPCIMLESHGATFNEDLIQDSIRFDVADLARRCEELRPKSPVSLVAIGCPQASVGELRQTAQLLKGKKVSDSPGNTGDPPPLWIFTSSANKQIAERTGLAKIIRESGALLLENTCPEVVPYDSRWVKHILTNSMKAEHYLQSGLNNIPTSVMKLADCIDVATGALLIDPSSTEAMPAMEPQEAPLENQDNKFDHEPSPSPLVESLDSQQGSGLPSQGDFTVTGEVFVTSAPITFLGFVDRLSGRIQEKGHPADGQSMAGRIAIYPKGTGSTVGPYVLLELFYRGVAPLAIVNTEIDQQTAPACSLENIPYAYGFDSILFQQLRTGDKVRISRRGDVVTLKRI